MTTVEITLNLPEELVQDALEWDVLVDELVAKLLQAEINRRRLEAEEEAEWETEVLTEALGDVLSPDGTIDFDKLDVRTQTITLDELYPEGADDEATS